MNRVRIWNVAVAAAFLAASFRLAIAQPPPDQGAAPPAPDPRAAIQSLLGDLDLGPLLMSAGGMSGATIDFTHSSERVIVKRNDVQGALLITAKQREQLTDLDTAGKQQMMQSLMQSATSSFKDNPALQASPDGTPPDLSQIKDVANQSIKSMQTAVQTLQGEMDKKGEAILTPKQIGRLHQLDLQWRGPLALSDKSVADRFNLTLDQQATVDGALKDYLALQSGAFKAVMQQMFSSPGVFSGRPNINPAQIQKSMMDAMQSDELTKARAADEKKVLAILTPAQKLLWTKMQGPKFAFRAVD